MAAATGSKPARLRLPAHALIPRQELRTLRGASRQAPLRILLMTAFAWTLASVRTTRAPGTVHRARLRRRQASNRFSQWSMTEVRPVQTRPTDRISHEAAPPPSATDVSWRVLDTKRNSSRANSALGVPEPPFLNAGRCRFRSGSPSGGRSRAWPDWWR